MNLRAPVSSRARLQRPAGSAESTFAGVERMRRRASAYARKLQGVNSAIPGAIFRSLDNDLRRDGVCLPKPQPEAVMGAEKALKPDVETIEWQIACTPAVA